MAAGETSAIILAGGQSRRMGQDKALLPMNGMTLLEHVVASLLRVATEVVVVADVQDKYVLPCGRVLADTFPGSGPVGGILTGLTALREGRHIVVACDMPLLNVAVLQLLLKAHTPEWDAVVPEINGQPEPLCAVYAHTAAPRLMRFLENGGRAAREALSHLRVKRVGEGVLRRIDPELACFTNVNTPEDLARLHRR
ncbi:MAG TPA: molybdenum cofactor guanylyltransferase [Chthonomonadaceae bacterium]|nr:molybdenum cofactor guanylyltransferase [Chthonomonadaceae bacterium]